ncbi:hypothetical protein BJL96_33335 [Burkholderia cenocepacia]|nr:hypothetical protein WM33_02660 [Burkholderia multivorans]KVR78296.1 hypothetical protein WK26_19785 [Burkholderia vietnamiensis]NGO91873.1 hypothetical protein [Burkholderia cenocepacia]KVS10343.1 hypothetical protein WK29_20125 [Burkholderia vietnamiensis]KVS35753.1 hypothetical protein WK35_03290 [Burkholderia vietnamiensis]
MGTKYQHRDAVTPGVIDCHARVHQPNVAVQGDGKRRTLHLRVTVSDGHGVFLMQAKKEFRVGVARVVDNAVMQSPETRARIQAQEWYVQTLEQFRDSVTSPVIFAILCDRAFSLVGIGCLIFSE